MVVNSLVHANFHLHLMMISPLKLPGVPASVQVESLRCLSYLCSQSEEGLHVQLVAEFPSILVPLASDDKVINPFA